MSDGIMGYGWQCCDAVFVSEFTATLSKLLNEVGPACNHDYLWQGGLNLYKGHDVPNVNCLLPLLPTS